MRRQQQVVVVVFAVAVVNLFLHAKRIRRRLHRTETIKYLLVRRKTRRPFCQLQTEQTP